MSSFEEVVQYEQSFWLQIVEDHSLFILEALAPTEKNEVKKAKAFCRQWERLRKESPMDLKASYELALQLRGFKLHLLQRLLTDQFSFHLTPSFMNHMVNEVEEYLRILNCLLEHQVPPPLHPMHHHLIWLQDAFGHASGLKERMDVVEKRLIEKSRKFQHQFEALYLKAVELTGYLRTNLKKFPALERFHHDVEVQMLLFMRFLEDLEELSLSKEILSTLAPRLMDHMYREECYYLQKLSEITKLRPPTCERSFQKG